MVRAASEDLRLRTEQRQYTSALGGGGVVGGGDKIWPQINESLFNYQEERERRRKRNGWTKERGQRGFGEEIENGNEWKQWEEKMEKEMGVKTEDELQRCAVVQSDLSLGRRPSWQLLSVSRPDANMLICLRWSFHWLTLTPVDVSQMTVPLSHY